MDEGFPSSLDPTTYLHADDKSVFYDHTILAIRDASTFREKLQALQDPDDVSRDRHDGVSQARSIRITIKVVLTNTGMMACHDGSDSPTGIGSLKGFATASPDGTMCMSEGQSPGMQLRQSILRDILAERTLRAGAPCSSSQAVSLVIVPVSSDPWSTGSLSLSGLTEGHSLTVLSLHMLNECH